ncbi:MAG: histidine--tRNA ligase [Phycisphaerae bacterium]|jgi:histidyl-tRNA synthetase
MKIPPVKGTRDFYPEEMRVHNFIVDGWKRASVRNGFEEYDGPIFEHLQMYKVKSGDEIAEQLFSLTDRGGRELAIRPEITPTLARMVNQKINSLPRPIKWFSVPRLCRAERPQKGRLREFFQWNVDIIGVDDVLADAEVIFAAVDYLRSVGLTEKDIQVKYSSRKVLTLYLKSLGIAENKLSEVYRILDKREKIPADVFEKMLSDCLSDKKIVTKVLDYMEKKMIVEDIARLEKTNKEMTDAFKELYDLNEYLKDMGIDEYCVEEPSIVRGLAYYTGIVFEIHDSVGDLRAICGGGRFDNLLHDFGGPSISATGFGMGDCVLEILLEERGLLKDRLQKGKTDYFVAYAEELYKRDAVDLVAQLRGKNKIANFSYKGGGLGKQLKEASMQNAGKCVIIGSESERGELAIKDMATGEQVTVKEEEFFKSL